ncbi:MAG: LysM peptidoglycan-binding domain-containing protein [Bdellovibrionales bacterium]|nr:LysM peptidoglycan-binding domain-containing protein [Bdellovibrionales bacterium]
MRKCSTGLVLVAWVGLTACGHFQSPQVKNDSSSAESESPESLAVIKGANDNLSDSPVQVENIPIEVNKQVQKWVNYFQGRGRRYMETYLERSSRYLPMMKAELRSQGLPDDLVYVSLIESGFSHKANSHAAAVGYWQFIRETGKIYGLRIDPFVDERRDPVLSTQAAGRYFKALHNLFGNWYLALASYNTGENRVKRAVMRHYTRDFWELSKNRRLPRETANYVPKFIAATLIAKNPEDYGFHKLSYEAEFGYETIEITKPISLQKLASGMSSASYEDLQRLNPMFRTYYVPVEPGSTVTLRVPIGSREKALAAIDLSDSIPPVFVASESGRYRIRRGDSLSVIARRYHTSVATLRRLNDFSNRSLLRIGQRIRVPEREPDVYLSHRDTASLEKSGQSNSLTPDIKYHVMKRGENLNLVAKRYGTTTENLKLLNNLSRRGVVFVGQKIAVKAEKGRVHVVRRGETLTNIARQYGVNITKIALANQLSNRSNIMIGSELVIPQ